MVFDKYSRQQPAKPGTTPEPAKPSGGAPTSSYLSRLAGSVGAGSAGSSYSPGKPGSSYGGNSNIWTGSSADKNVRSSIEKRLNWVETAFKTGSQGGAGSQGEDARRVASSVRNRINALLTYDLPPRIRSELELIDKELNKIL